MPSWGQRIAIWSLALVIGLLLGFGVWLRPCEGYTVCPRFPCTQGWQCGYYCLCLFDGIRGQCVQLRQGAELPAGWEILE